MAATRYGWTWIEGEDDQQGDSWIEVGPLDEHGYLSGDELAVIVCRNYEQVRAAHPEWIEAKERAALHIVSALNLHAALAEETASLPRMRERAGDAEDDDAIGLIDLIAEHLGVELPAEDDD
jgi:hypothetical protein